MNQAKIRNFDKRREPTDELVQDGIMQNLVIESEARQDLYPDQHVDDEIRQRRKRIVAHAHARIESQEGVKLEHVSDTAPLLAADGNVSRPPRPEITPEKPVEPQNERCDQHEA